MKEKPPLRLEKDPATEDNPFPSFRRVRDEVENGVEEHHLEKVAEDFDVKSDIEQIEKDLLSIPTYEGNVLKAPDYSSFTPDKTQEEEDEEVSESRRNFVIGAASLAAGAVAWKYLPDSAVDNIDPEQRVESKEDIAVERFRPREIEGYKALVRLKKNEVLFVDEDNQPIGKPLEIKDFIGNLPPGRTVKPGELEKFTFSLEPYDRLGLPVGKVGPEFRRGLMHKYLETNEIGSVDRMLHVYQDFQAAYKEEDEPELIRLIENGDIETNLDIIHYFASKEVKNPAPGGEGLNRLDYAQKIIKFEDFVPAVIQEELRWAVPGLCANESKFNAGLTSVEDGEGIFQITPDVWEENDGVEGGQKSLRLQTEVAGRALSTYYKRLVAHIDGDIMGKLRSKFDSDEEFDKQLMTPLILNAYNGGAARVSQAVGYYVDNTKIEDIPEGSDLYIAIADYAENSSEGYLEEYKNESREYVSRTYAWAEILNVEK